ncbi:MAG: substrate-binding domain-containing protein [Sphaerochaetaceae bacterium]|nr:substrate-binding domain-containing protein [Sphaerochaetaceae bacterium]
MEKVQDKQNLIYNELIKELKSSLYTIGDRLPSETRLAKQFQVSRPTINKVMQRLREEGIVESRAGVGTTVISLPANKSDTKTFGLILPFLKSNGLFPILADEIASLSGRYNYNIIWGGQFPAGTPSANQLFQMAEFYIQQKVDGVFFAPTELSPSCKSINQEIVRRIKRNGISLVILDAGYVDFPQNMEFDFVSIDNYRAGYTLGEYFVKKGCRRIDFCTYPFIGEAVKLRFKGIKDAMLDAGIIFDDKWTHLYTKNKQDYINEIIKSKGTTIIGSNDDIANATLRLLQERGYNIPEDFEVAGFDNSDLSRSTYPRITTIEQPCKDLAHLAINTMLLRIEHPELPKASIMSNFTLIKRGSTK